MQREQDEKRVAMMLNRVIANANWNGADNANCVDPNLFSMAVKDKKVGEASFLALVEYMNANAIPIPDSFFLNAFKSLLWAKENINSLLDIVDYFSEEQNAGVTDVRSSVWRRMMCVLTENEAPDADAFVGMKGSEKPNRYLLLSSLVEYLRQHVQCISFPLHTGLLHRSLRVIFCLLSMTRIRSVSATNCLM